MMIFHSYVKLPEGIPLLDDILNFFLSIHRLHLGWSKNLVPWLPSSGEPHLSPFLQNGYLRGKHHFQTHLDIIFSIYIPILCQLCIYIVHICWLDPH
jgi:hypothetical protein